MDKLSSIASHARNFGLTPIKKLGQNFIYDQSLCDKIVLKSGGLLGKEILEIGPGPGGLTRSILEQNPKRLIVIEKDERSINLLEDLKKYYKSLDILHKDAMKIKIRDLNLTSKIKIIANLPYNIGTKLLLNWSNEIELIEDIIVMLQKEVVDRICAKTGTKEYGRLSVIMQILFNPEKQFDVSRESFYPMPKVTSSIVKLVPKLDIPNLDLINKLEKITQIAFSARRKQIGNSLSKSFKNIDIILENLSIKNTQRPEEISPQLYLNIAKLYGATTEK
jgi:16S rRNA (adenine1518-N6/adenine1519-N6)-dimethyltransferase